MFFLSVYYTLKKTPHCVYPVHEFKWMLVGLVLICSVKQFGGSRFPWITSAAKCIPTWSGKYSHLNESTNLFSVWSWLNILSDLYDYGNHKDFLFLQKGAERQKKGVKSNKLSRLHSHDVFLEDWNTSENYVLLTLWQNYDTTQVAVDVICTHLLVSAGG